MILGSSWYECAQCDTYPMCNNIICDRCSDIGRFELCPRCAVAYAPDTCPAPAPTSAAGGGQLIIYALFKGTVFPLIMQGSPDMWDSSQETWNNMIIQGLRGGFSIPQQIEDYTRQLTRI